MMAKTDGRRMTAAQEAFARAVAGGTSKYEAYKQAYPRSQHWKRDSVDTEAKRVARVPVVADRIATLQAKAAQVTLFTLRDHLQNLHEISIAALNARDFSGAARAEIARGQAAGFYKQRVELTGKDGKPIETRQTRDLTDEELAAELQRYGIDPRPVKPGTAGSTH